MSKPWRVTHVANIFLNRPAPVNKQGPHHNVVRAARRPHILCLTFVPWFGALVKSVRLFSASFHGQPMCSQMYTADIFGDLQPVGWNWMGDFSTPWFGGLGKRKAHSIARPWVSITFPLTHVIVPVLTYLAGSNRISVRLSDPDTMTITALETVASSIDENTKPMRIYRHLW